MTAPGRLRVADHSTARRITNDERATAVLGLLTGGRLWITVGQARAICTWPGRRGSR